MTMLLFLPIQQELDCISSNGLILGKIRFDDSEGRHIFYELDDSPKATSEEEFLISERLQGLDSGKYSIPMQDDD